MSFDDSLQLEGAGAGVVLVSLDGVKTRHVLRMHFRASNNAVEYEALLHGLRTAISLGVRRISIFDDSAVVMNQVTK